MKNIKSFEEFSVLEYVTNNQGANLSTNSTPDQVTFDGGDGPSAMASDGDKTNHVVKKMKKFRGNDAKKKQKERKEKNKKYDRENKVMNMSPDLVSGSNFGDNDGGGSSSGGGGASYATQGF